MRTLKTVRYRICSKQLPAAFKGVRIAHLSDLHGALYGRHQELLLKKISEARPLLVMMTGDMADDTKGAVSRLLDLCRRLCSQYPVYFVVGNHEQCLRKELLDGLLAELRSLGAAVLDNEWRTVSYRGAFIKVYGLVTPMVYYKDPLGEYVRGIHFSREDAVKALGEADPSCFKILLAHNPLYYPSYREWGADLTLSGHIHGGIIRIPGIGGLLSPDLSLFPKYDGGHFREDGRHLVVSRGLGNHFLIRVHNPPELVILTLYPEEV